MDSGEANHRHVAVRSGKPTEIFWIGCQGDTPTEVNRRGNHMSIGQVLGSKIGSRQHAPDDPGQGAVGVAHSDTRL
ncbi:MAG TPA: hypothetical protein VE078_14540, partial [Thermoanaerobaculia bacterium]|nr:hypothetical protein [Thermoanaerobaculia bacterium]